MLFWRDGVQLGMFRGDLQVHPSSAVCHMLRRGVLTASGCGYVQRGGEFGTLTAPWTRLSWRGGEFRGELGICVAITTDNAWLAAAVRQSLNTCGLRPTYTQTKLEVYKLRDGYGALWLGMCWASLHFWENVFLWSPHLPLLLAVAMAITTPTSF